MLGHRNALLLWLITKRSASPLQVEELYDAYCIQRRLRDGASKMVAAFNSATGSREARESLSEANKGYKECTEVNDGCEANAGDARYLHLGLELAAL